MKYRKTFLAKNGKEVLLRNGEAADGAAVLENFNRTHAETDYLLTYPDENRFDAEQEGRFLARKAESPGRSSFSRWLTARSSAPPVSMRSAQNTKWRTAPNSASAY